MLDFIGFQIASSQQEQSHQSYSSKLCCSFNIQCNHSSKLSFRVLPFSSQSVLIQKKLKCIFNIEEEFFQSIITAFINSCQMKKFNIQGRRDDCSLSMC